MSAPGWLTGKADAASLAALAERLATQVDVSTVDELFLFPTRRVAGVESTVFVLSMHERDELRKIVTAHVRATRNKRGEPAIESTLNEQAIVPIERIPRVIEGVLKRLTADFATPPSTARIQCSAERWHRLVEVLMTVKPSEPLPEDLLDSQKDADEVDN